MLRAGPRRGMGIACVRVCVRASGVANDDDAPRSGSGRRRDGTDCDNVLVSGRCVRPGDVRSRGPTLIPARACRAGYRRKLRVEETAQKRHPVLNDMRAYSWLPQDDEENGCGGWPDKRINKLFTAEADCMRIQRVPKCSASRGRLVTGPEARPEARLLGARIEVCSFHLSAFGHSRPIRLPRFQVEYEAVRNKL